MATVTLPTGQTFDLQKIRRFAAKRGTVRRRLSSIKTDMLGITTFSESLNPQSEQKANLILSHDGLIISGGERVRQAQHKGQKSISCVVLTEKELKKYVVG